MLAKTQISYYPKFIVAMLATVSECKSIPGYVTDVEGSEVIT